MVQDNQEKSQDTQEERTLPYRLVRRLATLALAIGLLGGLVGGYVFTQLAPDLLPTSKQSVVLQQSSATIDVVKKISPSVVSITSEAEAISFFGGSQTTEGAGTGLIVAEDGLIVTNNHVVEDTTSLTVFTADGKEYKDAEIVARDPQNDLAFIRIKAQGLKPAELGDSSRVEVGTQVLAIGNALGQFHNTVTEGIISGIGRPVTAGGARGGDVEQLQNLFQTDAAINPGNSGGPLVDLTGKVIGINTAVAGNAQNIGFAIPVNLVKSELDAVKSEGRIIRPYLGVRYVPVTREFASSNNLSVNNGAFINGDEQSPGVVVDSPAAKAGLREGDIITKVNEDEVDGSHGLATLISRYNVGDTVKLTVWRNGRELTLEAKLEEAPQAQ